MNSGTPASSLEATRCQPAYKPTLQEEEKDDDGQDYVDGGGAREPPVLAVGALECRKLVVTGLRFLSWMKVMAKKNSFHAWTPVTSATVRRPGQLRGSTTRSMTCSSFAPSMRAASSKSRGSPTR